MAHNVLDKPYSDRRLILFVDDEVIGAYEKAEDAVAESRQFTLSAEAYLEYFKVRLKHLYVDDQIRLLGLVRVCFLAKRAGVDIKLVEKSKTSLLLLPPGHPRDGVVYAGHPALSKYYLPITEFHRVVFEHKFSEAVSMLMHLGAKNIRIKHVKGWGLHHLINLSAETSGAQVEPAVAAPLALQETVSTVVPAVTGRTLLDAYKSRLYSAAANEPALPEDLPPLPPEPPPAVVSDPAEQTVLLRTPAKPATPPRLPANMVWHAYEPTWQLVSEGRMKFGVEEFVIDLNYREDFDINPLLYAKLEKAGFHLNVDFECHKPTMWRLFGEFWRM